MCCQVEVSATGRSLVQRSPTESGVPECDLETSTMRRPRPIRAVESWKKGVGGGDAVAGTAYSLADVQGVSNLSTIQLYSFTLSYSAWTW